MATPAEARLQLAPGLPLAGGQLAIDLGGGSPGTLSPASVRLPARWTGPQGSCTGFVELTPLSPSTTQVEVVLGPAAADRSPLADVLRHGLVAALHEAAAAWSGPVPAGADVPGSRGPLVASLPPA